MNKKLYILYEYTLIDNESVTIEKIREYTSLKRAKQSTKIEKHKEYIIIEITYLCMYNAEDRIVYLISKEYEGKISLKFSKWYRIENIEILCEDIKKYVKRNIIENETR